MLRVTNKPYVHSAIVLNVVMQGYYPEGIMLSIVMLSVTVLNVAWQSHYTECHDAKCHYDECNGACTHTLAYFSPPSVTIRNKNENNTRDQCNKYFTSVIYSCSKISC
jgi:hypothetical protein